MAMPPPKRIEMGHCTGFLGRRNYPQRWGTRPAPGVRGEGRAGGAREKRLDIPTQSQPPFGHHARTFGGMFDCLTRFTTTSYSITHSYEPFPEDLLCQGSRRHTRSAHVPIL